MTEAEDLVAAVRVRTEGTPYVLTETERGFDVQIDLTDTSWHARLHQRHLRETWIYRVRIEEAAKTLSITDDVRSVNWRARVGSADGVPAPVVSGGASRFVGRFEVRSFRKTWGVDERGNGQASELRFSSSEGRDLIRVPARELGWTERRGVPELIGLYVGVGTLALLVLAGIVVAIVALAGGL